jgi:hypothetical protein
MENLVMNLYHDNGCNLWNKYAGSICNNSLDYCQNNQERIKEYQLEYQLEYRKNNKEKIKDKEYYKNNKEYYQEYYKNNQERINEKFNCICGGKYTYSAKARHYKTAKHLQCIQ